MMGQEEPAGPSEQDARPARHGAGSVRVMFVVIGSLMVVACLVGAVMASGLTR
ncbi:hypothetical protein [Actinocatenispora rupis]|uniref:Uncharacterized protein n=1 Tax=Actinocatenispora rupis TaxID=519421 RepID=A0A8J3J778_9ACTN|nr:hypothetical protein [Actinocatenispora rupis]GID11349.1 hypothetical protein Aru02nite_22380 [Actinocatenispora rupis]